MVPITQQQGQVPKKKALLIAVRYEELHRKYPDEKPPFRLDGTHGDPPVVARWLIGETTLVFVP